MAAPDPDSIAGVAARLALWGSRAPKGLARVEFDSDFSRREVDARVRDACAQSNIPFYAIELPRNTPAPEVVTYLLDTLAPLPHGLVSITGWATAFPADVPLIDSLRVLNYNRENLAQFPLCQIWWLTRPLTDAIIRNIPDLASWFIVRLDLRESIATLQEKTSPSVVSVVSPEQQDAARKQATDLVSRFDVALERGENAAVLLMLAGTAIVTLDRANLTEEAQTQAANLLERIIDSLVSQERYASFSRDAFNHSAAWKEILPTQSMDTHNRMSDLALLVHLSGRTQEAGEIYKAAVEMTLAKSDSVYPSNTPAMYRLAQFYVEQGNYDDAISLFQHFIAILEAWPRPQELLIVDCLSVLAGFYSQKGDYSEAEKIYHRALKIGMNFRGVLVGIEGMLCHNLAVFYRRLGRFAEAEMYTARAEALRSPQGEQLK